MPVSIDTEVHGDIEAMQEMDRIITELHGEKMLQGMRDATLWITRDAKTLAPVDTGRLRASITPDVQLEADAVLGVVGSNVLYAPYMELGTRPHWPPRGALAVWAERHGIPEFLVMRAIAMRGTKAYKFLQGAFEQNKDRIERILEHTVEGIVK